LTDALFDFLELRLGFEFVSALRDGPIILGSKSSAKFLGAIP
jgi:hypothetical protein